MLEALREKGLIGPSNNQKVSILNSAGLSEAANFDAALSASPVAPVAAMIRLLRDERASPLDLAHRQPLAGGPSQAS